MASSRDAEEEERRLDMDARSAGNRRPINTAATSASAASAASAPPSAAPRNASHQQTSAALRGDSWPHPRDKWPNPPPTATAAATTQQPVAGGRNSNASNSNATARGTGLAPVGQEEPEGAEPQFHHNIRLGGPQPWGVGGGVGAAPYRPNAPVFGLVGDDNDMLPSVLGPTDYAAVLAAGGLGDATTLVGAGGGAPLQTHSERMEARARAAAQRAVDTAHAALAHHSHATAAATQPPPAAATDSAAKQKQHKNSAAAADATAPIAAAAAVTSGTQEEGATGERRRQNAANAPPPPPSPPPAVRDKDHVSPGMSHDVGYEHDL